jgi:antitoxin Phd
MPPHTAPRQWKLEDAKSRLSEVVRRARDEGPQSVTVRGRRAVVVLDADTYDRMTDAKPTVPLVTFLESLELEGLDLTREPDIGRDVAL